MNSNMFHNIANAVMALVGLVTAILMALGCSTLPTGAIDCTASAIISPQLSLWIVGALGVLKIIVNMFRDGVSGLTKPQPPVEK